MISIWNRIIKANENRQKIKSEQQILNAIPTHDLDHQNLTRLRGIDLKNCFKSEEILRVWQDACRLIDPFEIPDGTGGINPGDRRAIFYLIHSLSPDSVLEIGTHIGASTMMYLTALMKREVAGSTRPHLTTVDISDVNDPVSRPWLQYGGKLSPAEMAAAIGLSDIITFNHASSIEFMSECRLKFDYIFLDGDHTAATVYQEIPLALNLLKPGGIIMLHDYFPKVKPLWSNRVVIPGPYLAVNRLITEGNTLSAYPLGKLPWVTKLQSNITSLALLLKV